MDVNTVFLNQSASISCPYPFLSEEIQWLRPVTEGAGGLQKNGSARATLFAPQGPLRYPGPLTSHPLSVP